jgi:hypothetical protein
MTAIENAAICNRCRKSTMDWIKDKWLVVIGRVWVGAIKQADHDSNKGHYCSWKCFGQNPVAAAVDAERVKGVSEVNPVPLTGPVG